MRNDTVFKVKMQSKETMMKKYKKLSAICGLLKELFEATFKENFRTHRRKPKYRRNLQNGNAKNQQ